MSSSGLLLLLEVLSLDASTSLLLHGVPFLIGLFPDPSERFKPEIGQGFRPKLCYHLDTEAARYGAGE